MRWPGEDLYCQFPEKRGLGYLPVPQVDFLSAWFLVAGSTQYPESIRFGEPVSAQNAADAVDSALPLRRVNLS